MFFYRIRKRAFSFNTETYLKAQHFWSGSVRTKLCPTIFSPTWQLNISELNRFSSFTLTYPPCSSSWLFERARPSTIFQLTHSTHVKLPTWTHPPCCASSKLSHLMTLPPIPDTSSLPFGPELMRKTSIGLYIDNTGAKAIVPFCITSYYYNFQFMFNQWILLHYCY